MSATQKTSRARRQRLAATCRRSPWQSARVAANDRRIVRAACGGAHREAAVVRTLTTIIPDASGRTRIAILPSVLDAVFVRDNHAPGHCFLG